MLGLDAMQAEHLNGRIRHCPWWLASHREMVLTVRSRLDVRYCLQGRYALISRIRKFRFVLAHYLILLFQAYKLHWL